MTSRPPRCRLRRLPATSRPTQGRLEASSKRHHGPPDTVVIACPLGYGRYPSNCFLAQFWVSVLKINPACVMVYRPPLQAVQLLERSFGTSIDVSTQNLGSI